jgi:hypothetical protein
MSAHRTILALSFFYTFGLSTIAFAQQHFESGATTVVAASSSEGAAQSDGTRTSPGVATTQEANVRPTITPPGTVNDTQPVANRTATGSPRRLGPDQGNSECATPNQPIADNDSLMAQCASSRASSNK